MHAIVVDAFGPFEAASVRELPDPVPGPGEALVEMRAAAANFVDILQIGGTYQFKPALPFVPGKGLAGVVRAIGDGVARLKPGDRVLAMIEDGGYGELALAPEYRCHPLPPSMPFTDAAAMSTVYDTSWFALRERARYRQGETVLILGATGGVGLASVRLAKAFGATVLAGISSTEKSDLVGEAGADAVLDLTWPNLRDGLREQVHSVTAGKGVDIALDMLGGDVFEAALRCLAWRGRLVVIGFASGRIATIKANYLLVKNIEVSGLQVSDYRKRMPEETQQCFAELCSLYEAGKIGPGPVKVLPLSRFADALRALRDRTARGRLVLVPDAIERAVAE